MRHSVLLSLCLGSAIALSACSDTDEQQVEEAFKDVNVIDESNLNDVMLTVADPEEAVAYFQKTAAANPDRIDLKRGLGMSLIRAKRPTEAAAVWADVAAHPEATSDDLINLADAQIRSGKWDEAEATLDKIPPTYETFNRYRLEAMVADSNTEWKNADSFYETAVSLTTDPAGVLNNWGYSKLSRGQYADAERLFAEALTYDTSLFTAKNNLVLARGAQRQYDLPVIPMTQEERAMLLHTLGLSAVKQGDVVTGKTLLKEAVATHPQHFDAAVRSLRALEANVRN